ncbi:hypothetical protein ACFX1T_007377 [Malus domestica]
MGREFHGSDLPIQEQLIGRAHRTGQAGPAQPEQCKELKIKTHRNRAVAVPTILLKQIRVQLCGQREVHWARRSTIEKPIDRPTPSGARRRADIWCGAGAVVIFKEELVFELGLALPGFDGSGFGSGFGGWVPLVREIRSRTRDRSLVSMSLVQVSHVTLLSGSWVRQTSSTASEI